MIIPYAIKNVYRCGKKKLRGSFDNFAEICFIQKTQPKISEPSRFCFYIR